ncbi:hypothetical protein AIOL_001754 [Candidatus Rhodobacter oscarellae]|uniref:Uncharacterized protein n=1 Tax=Candidatus Rhodobacter oscarellae TaxID=1675527 RepID=A0A0J9GTH4_9RHOB|nr:hypothetical protein AIOL_001754 [Candidatus Rhodobacter lobularis]
MESLWLRFTCSPERFGLWFPHWPSQCFRTHHMGPAIWARS